MFQLEAMEGVTLLSYSDVSQLAGLLHKNLHNETDTVRQIASLHFFLLTVYIQKTDSGPQPVVANRLLKVQLRFEFTSLILRILEQKSNINEVLPNIPNFSIVLAHNTELAARYASHGSE
jgi:hypothetical protein